MSYRAWARPRVLQHAGRVVVVAFLAAIVLASASPAAARESYFSSMPLPAAPEVTVVPQEAVAEIIAEAIANAIAETTPETSVATAAPEPLLGSVIASTAMSYLGYPYVAAGAGPGGFDCSGFTQYMVGITTGIWISHAVEAQPWSAGYWVDYGNWLPGDLIFFQNTYRPGISHVGIYIGDGQIVHAENYDSGVTIDSIYSDYYGSRYYGAVRIG